MQGLGWLTTEELCWNEQGRLTTHAPSTYKIPAASDVPADFRVRLWDGENPEDSIHRSKAVGEPPLMLAMSVFHAIKRRDRSGGVGRAPRPQCAGDGAGDPARRGAAARMNAWLRCPRSSDARWPAGRDRDGRGGQRLDPARAGHQDAGVVRRVRGHHRRRASRIQGHRHRARHARRVAARPAALRAGREPGPVLRRLGDAAVRTGCGASGVDRRAARMRTRRDAVGTRDAGARRCEDGGHGRARGRQRVRRGGGDGAAARSARRKRECPNAKARHGSSSRRRMRRCTWCCSAPATSAARSRGCSARCRAP